jgi:beta-phosphoglucomutase-like phosphatase (HAD superfamily)
VTAVPTALIERLQVLLLDADGNLFPSEEPAFAASADVTNRFLASLGVDRAYGAEELRRVATGMNFRTTAQRLAAEHGHADADVEPWVEEERRAVTEHLAATLLPDRATLTALTALATYLPLAAVSSSALARLAGCFTATELDRLIPPAYRFSAEDSLPTPTSKPDPAIYLHACRQLGVAPEAALAVEDSVPGAQSAVGAGCPTVGNLVFVPPAERARREADLLEAGVLTVVSSWTELATLLLPTLARRPGAAPGSALLATGGAR